MLHLISGLDVFRAKQFVDHLTNRIKNIDPDISIQKIDGANIKPHELSDNLEPLALFTQKKIIIIKNLFTTKNQIESREVIINYLNKTDFDNHLIIWEQNNLDKRSKIYKKIKKLAKNFKNENLESKIINDFPLLKKHELISWLHQYCHQNQINIHPSAIVALVNHTQNTYSIHNELQKTKTYSRNHITTEIIDKLSAQAPQNIIFDLTDQIGHKKNTQAFETAINLVRQGEEPLKIMAALATHIQSLMAVKELFLSKNNPAQIQEKTKIHSFVIKKCLEQSPNFSLPDLTKIHHHLATSDYKLKTGQSDFETEMFRIITNYK